MCGLRFGGYSQELLIIACEAAFIFMMFQSILRARYTDARFSLLLFVLIPL